MVADRVSGSEVRGSAAMEVAARLGLTARALIYLLIAILTLVVALSRKRPETDQRGALQALTTHTGGAALLLLIAIGFATYALWRFAEAAFGAAGDGEKKGARLKSLARGVSYTVLSVTAFAVLAGRHSSQAGQSEQLSARIMKDTGGQVLVAVIGVVVAAVGVVMIVEGVCRKFEKYLRLGGLSARARKAVVTLGVVGTVARGALFALVGALVLDAAVAYEPTKAGGVDTAIRTLAEQPFGRTLLVITALGLFAFGAYGLAEARWRVT